MDVLADAIARRFDGARVEARDGVLVAEVPHDGSWYRARLVMAPLARVEVSIPACDGFELALRWSDRWCTETSHEATVRVVAARPGAIDDSFFVETNDLGLAHLWLDGRTRDTLLASRYVSRARALDATAELVRDGTWTHEVGGERVIASRREPEVSVVRMADLLAASVQLASLPMRWAAQAAGVARQIGGQSSSRVELGGRPAIRALRGNLEVTVTLLRRLAPGETGRLRTRVAAHRVGSGERLALVRDGMPRDAARPGGDSIGALMLDGEAARLLDRARPSAASVHAQQVEILFDGAMLDAARLEAAVDLAAHWVAPNRAPYR